MPQVHQKNSITTFSGSPGVGDYLMLQLMDRLVFTGYTPHVCRMPTCISPDLKAL